MTERSRSPWSAITRLIKASWLIIGIVLILLLLVDAILDATLPEPWQDDQILPGAEEPSRRASDALANADWISDYEREHKAAKAMRWEPYLYWRRATHAGDHINVDADGRRQTWTAPAVGDGPTLWMFGGSTVWGTGVPDALTLPSQLARQSAAAGAPIQVVNHGESGYVSTQGVIGLLRELQRGERPDIVVFYDGVNDVFAALQGQPAGTPQNETLRALDFAAGRGDLAALALRRLEGVARLAAADRPELDLEATAAQIAEAYAVNVEAVTALAARFGFDAWFFWQPSIFDRPRPTEFEQRVLDAAYRSHRDLQLAANAAVRARLADHPGFIDLTAALDAVEETVYLDFAHLGPRGNEVIARTILDQLGTTTE